MWSVFSVKVLFDNVSWVLTSGNKALVVDPGEARPIIDFLTKNNLSCEAILITHLHPDHIGGLKGLISHYESNNLTVYGPKELQSKSINNFICSLENKIVLNDEVIEVKHTPGHCSEHICYVFPDSKILLCGDVLFSVGCGRIISGTMEQLWQSLNWILSLADDLIVCCGHDYTLKNVEFAYSLFPTDTAIKYRLAQVKNQLSTNNSLTIPTLLREEKKINPFLRCNDKLLLESWGQQDSYPARAFDRFVKLRKARNNF